MPTSADQPSMKNTSPQREKRQRVVPFLITSLFLHIFLFLGFQIHQAYFADQEPEKVVVVEPSVEFINFDMNAGRLVEQDENEKTLEKPKDAKFMSAQDKVVKKETRAVHRGDFQNKNSAAAPEKPKAEPSKSSQAKAAQVTATDTSANAENMKTFEGGDMAVPSKKKEQKALTVMDLRPNTMAEMSQAAMASVSQTRDMLKDVAAGAETHLNTREFIYYSYFNRIKRQLHQRWEPLIHSKVKTIVKKGQERELASSEMKLTNVVFTLDDHGVIKRIQIATTSGLEDLDDAAVEALQAVGQFPNPPKDLVIEGFVKIQWSFILES